MDPSDRNCLLCTLLFTSIFLLWIPDKPEQPEGIWYFESTLCNMEVINDIGVKTWTSANRMSTVFVVEDRRSDEVKRIVYFPGNLSGHFLTVEWVPREESWHWKDQGHYTEIVGAAGNPGSNGSVGRTGNTGDTGIPPRDSHD